MNRALLKSILLLVLTIPLLGWFAGCAQIRLPRIDPSGNRLFLPGTTSIGSPTGAVPAYSSPATPPPCPYPGQAPLTQAPLNPLLSNQPIGSGISAAPQLPPQRILPPAPEFTIPRKSGRIILTPDEIVAPVGSEVIVMAGICGHDGHYVIRQPIEFMLSQESVGNMVTVADTRNSLISGVIGPNARKLSTGFAKSVTSSQGNRITKGTPSPGDDVYVAKGQTWVTLTSPTEGTSHVTCVAPEAEGWDRRRATAKIHWLDAQWQLPTDVTLTNGQTHELPVILTRSNGEPIPGWEVTYEIIGGNNAGFLPTGSQKAELASNNNGQANVAIRQLQNGPAYAQVRIQVVRPGNPFGTQRMLSIVDQVVNIRWTAPALSIEVVGPDQIGRDAEFTYRVNIRNPGDAVARNAIVRLDNIDPKLEVLSMEPQGRVVGGQIEWAMGDIRPNQVPYSIDLKLKAFRAGKTQTCFSVQSVEDRLAPVKACIESNVSVPCIGLKINGPTEARVGQTVTYTLRVENQCQQPLSGVQLVCNYDAGLNFPGNPSPIEQSLTEQIGFGFYKELEISFEVTQAGRQCFTIDVTSNDGSKARIQQCVQVTENPAPQLSVSLGGPAIGEVNQTGRYVIDVKNTGNVPLTNLEVALAFDRAFIPEMATDGYRQRAEDELFWQFERLEVGEVLGLAVDQRFVRQSDNAIHLLKVTSREGLEQKDQVRTVIRPEQRPINPPDAVRNNELSNTLKIRAAALTNPVNPADKAEIRIELLNDRPANDFEEDVQVLVTVPNDLQFFSGPEDLKIEARVENGQTTYRLEPIQALRGSQPRTLNLQFTPRTPDRVHDVIVRVRSRRTEQPIETQVQITVTR